MTARQAPVVDVAADRPLPLEAVRRPLAERLANECLPRKASHHAEPCLACGRPLTERAVGGGWWVHLLTDGTIAPVIGAYVTPAMLEGDLDQGWFPIGSECARRVPETHRRRLAEVTLKTALVDVAPEYAAQATALYGHGYRPVEAWYVTRGQDVAYRTTDAFGLEALGDFLIARVEEVAWDHAGTVTLSSRDFAAGPTAEVDECEPVWAR